MIEGKTTIEANSTSEIFIEDVRGYKNVQLKITEEGSAWGRVFLFGGFDKKFTDHSFKTQNIHRDMLSVFDIEPGYSFLKCKVHNASYLLPMEIKWKLILE